MQVHLGKVTLHVTLNRSAAAGKIAEMLPLEGWMTRFDDREFYMPLPVTPDVQGEQTRSFCNGDVAYYPPYNTLAVFYARERESPCPGLIPIGRIAGDYSGLESLEERVFSRIEADETDKTQCNSPSNSSP